MTTIGIHNQRIRQLNDRPVRSGRFVLYWMQQSQRSEFNHALEFGIQKANQLKQPLLVVFGLTEDYPEANMRHYAFMLQGLQETRASLAARGIKMVLRRGSPPDVALQVGRHASVIVCDKGYLRHQRKWRRKVAKAAMCLVTQVEGDAIVPVEVVSDKQEYAARTIRPKIQRHLDTFLQDLPQSTLRHHSMEMTLDGVDLDDINEVAKTLNVDQSVRPTVHFMSGGTSRAKQLFDDFVNNRLEKYVTNRNQPQTDDTSHMSPYLHFGQISPLQLALSVKSLADNRTSDAESFLEELIVRRELAINFVYYNPDYDRFEGLPDWARKTLHEHRLDKRGHAYSKRRMENAQTHDPYWNAAMNEMKTTGYLHNHMRMYWGKKILQWSPTPEDAFKITLALNNKYLIDGRDPNSYAGVAWVFGAHDRAWKERPVFGKVRYMNAAGLERKCDIGGYVQKVDNLMKKDKGKKTQ